MRTKTSVHYSVDAAAGPGCITTGDIIVSRTLTLDDAVKYTKHKPVGSLLWMDCEGSEKLVLEGGQNTLKSTHAVICELRDNPPESEWPSKEEMVLELKSLGFKLVATDRKDGLFLRE